PCWRGGILGWRYRRMPMSGFARLLPLVCCLVLALSAVAPGQEWTRFRGPNGSGIADANLPLKWTEKDYAWKIRLPGVGHSSPIVWGERLFVTCADEKTGQRI